MRRRGRMTNVLVTGTVVYVLSMSLFPFHPARSIELSFPGALHRLAADGISYGDSVAYTYGPLGFLSFPQLYSPTTSSLAILFAVGVGYGAVLVTLTMLTRAMNELLAAVVTYLFMVLGWNRLLELEWTPEAAAALVAILSVWSLTWFLEGRPFPTSTWIIAGALGSLIGMFSLVKVSTGIQIAVVGLPVVWVSTSGADRGTARRVLPVATTMLVAGVVLVILWLGSGQSFDDLPVFIRHSYEFTSGYSSSMSLQAPGIAWQRTMALLLIVLVVWVVVEKWGIRKVRQNPAIVVSLSGFLFFAFKHSFVRFDEHALVFFVVATFLVLGVLSRSNRWAVLSVVAFGLIGAFFVSGLKIPHDLNPKPHLEQAADVTQIVFDRSAMIDQIDEQRAGVRSRHPLSADTIHAISSASVHVDPFEIGMLWAYPELSWGAPPVFQTYAAFTEDLDELNRAFLASDRAPGHVLRRSVAIDGRNPAFESPEYMIEMACRYSEVSVDNVWVVLNRTDDFCLEPHSRQRRAAQSSETILVPEMTCQGEVVFRVDGFDSFQRTIRNLLYREPAHYIVYHHPDGSEYRNRFLLDTARQWHLLVGEETPSWVGPQVLVPGVGLSITGIDDYVLEFGCLERQSS